MKLRNKKTGESINFDILPEEVKRAIEVGVTYFWYNYELYTPAEPLIKDEKVRKAVRAWAEATGEDCYYGRDESTISNESGDAIRFANKPFANLVEYEHYTIAELCGEEEE